MSIEIQRSKEDETVAEYVHISGGFLSIYEISSFTKIERLEISNIEDAIYMKMLLSSLPNEIGKITCAKCNMEGCDMTFLNGLRSLTEIRLIQNTGVEYNEILSKIPNKKLMKEIFFWSAQQEQGSIDIKKLEEFTSLRFIGLRDFPQIDIEKLQTYLLGVQTLEELTIGGDIHNIDFISKINLEHITILAPNLDLSLITPEIARKHNNVTFVTDKGTIATDATENGYQLRIISLIDIKQLDSISLTIEHADTVKMSESATIHINNESDICMVLEKEDVLSKFSGISIGVPYIGGIQPEQLLSLKEKININRIAVMDKEYSQTAKGFQYLLSEYEMLYNKVQEIVGDIPENFTDLQKFMIIYQKLGLRIVYDHELIKEEHRQKEEKSYQLDYVNNNGEASRNLVNGLIKGKCVCAGYSDILYNCLQSEGIDACKIGGDEHAWNKVQIDGVWYNVDLTWDCKEITQHNARGLKYCLRSDEKFKEGHEQEDGKKVECNTDYSREEIVKAMRFAERFNDRALEAEYETVTEEPSFFDKLKARAMTLFGRRKMIEAPQTPIEVKTTEERREEWMKKSGIVLHNGQELSTINNTEVANARGQRKDREFIKD